MKNYKIYIPEGVQDILTEECFIKRNIEDTIREVFKRRAYLEIETPTIEFYDTFSAEGELIPQETMFKFFDQQGRILVLRPDMTIPIARIISTKLKSSNYPIKLSYIGNTFKYNEHGGGKQKEFTQAGVEIIGVDTSEADAEVIATAINSIRAVGLENFQIDIGQVEFFKGLMEETELPQSNIDEIITLINNKDFLGIEKLVKNYDIRNDLKELIYNLPSLFGSIDIIDKVEKITKNSRSLNSLENLRKVYEILADYDLSKYISIDLGMIQKINYYTGIIFRGLTHGVGFPIVSGGRYDNLIEKFGKRVPATGFSIGINMLMISLERQNVISKKPKIDKLICYSEKARKKAFLLYEDLRYQGLSVEIDIANLDINSAKEYALKKGIDKVIYIDEQGKIAVYNIGE